MKILNMSARGFICIILTSLWTGAFALAAHHEGEEEQEEQTPLAASMEEMSDALKSLRRMEKDDWQAGVRAARTAVKACYEAMKYTPALLNDMPDGKEKEKALADYRRLLGLSYVSLCELELSFLEQDQEKVTATLKKNKSTKKRRS